MRICEHKTWAIFDRYNIVNEEDLKKASARIAQVHRKAQKKIEKQCGYKAVVGYQLRKEEQGKDFENQDNAREGI